MIKVSEIAFICYPVIDMARARKFYEDVLGLQATTSYGEAGGMQWTEYDIANGTLALGCGAPDWRPREDGSALALEVENFDEAIAHLRGHQAKFRSSRWPRRSARWPSCLIPKATCLCIHKRKAG